MKRLALLLLISTPFLLGSCSDKNFARVEDDDMYFTHKDRKRAKEAEKLAQANESNKEQNDKPVHDDFYDAATNPDYAITEETTDEAGVYYEDEPVSNSGTPQVNNYYFYNSPAYYDPFASYFNPVFFSISWGYAPVYLSYPVYYYPYYPVYYDPFYCPLPYGNAYGGGVYFDTHVVAYGPRTNRAQYSYVASRHSRNSTIATTTSHQNQPVRGRSRGGIANNGQDIRPGNPGHFTPANDVGPKRGIRKDNQVVKNDRRERKPPVWWQDAADKEPQHRAPVNNSRRQRTAAGRGRSTTPAVFHNDTRSHTRQGNNRRSSSGVRNRGSNASNSKPTFSTPRTGSRRSSGFNPGRSGGSRSSGSFSPSRSRSSHSSGSFNRSGSGSRSSGGFSPSRSGSSRPAGGRSVGSSSGRSSGSRSGGTRSSGGRGRGHN